MDEETMSTVAVLARLAGSDDEAAWSQLIDRHGQRIYRIARSILDDADLAEDAVQEALLYIRDHAGDFRPQSSVVAQAECQAGAWIKRIACTAALQLARSRAIHRKHSARYARQVVAAGEASDVAVVAADAESIQALRQALQGLPERHRQVLTLHFFGGLEYRQLAAELRCSVGACRVRLHRALKVLRRRLRKLGVAIGLLALGSRLEAAARVARAATGCWRALLYDERHAGLQLPAAAGGGATVAAALLATTLLLTGGAWWAADRLATEASRVPVTSAEMVEPVAVPAEPPTDRSTVASGEAAVADGDAPVRFDRIQLQHGPYEILGTALSDGSRPNIRVLREGQIRYRGVLEADSLAERVPRTEAEGIVAAVEGYLAERRRDDRSRMRQLQAKRAVDGSVLLQDSDGKELPIRLQVGTGGLLVRPAPAAAGDGEASESP